jgi:RNA polymerase sigma-70 factor (ECF subfamily)
VVLTDSISPTGTVKQRQFERHAQFDFNTNIRHMRHTSAQVPVDASVFATTHWSVVLAATDTDSPGAQQALEQLCRTYWYPLYCFVRRQGYRAEDAQDFTQEFFARFLERKYFGLADPARGRFRSFLLKCLKNFLAEQHRHAVRLKRGGGHTVLQLGAQQDVEERFVAEPADNATPETIYDQRWAMTLLERVLQRLGEELAAAGNAERFAELKGHLWGEAGGAAYGEIGERLGMSEGAVKVAVHRLRERYRELLREEVAHTVARHEDIDDELRYLIAAIRGS